jgi:hypothetical protein
MSLLSVIRNADAANSFALKIRGRATSEKLLASTILAKAINEFRTIILSQK